MDANVTGDASPLAPLPPAVEPVFREAVAAVEAGTYERAEALFRAVLEHAPAHLAAQKNLALCSYKQRRFTDAEALYRRLGTLLPHDVEVLFGLAASVHESGRLREAVELYRAVLARDPHHVRGNHNLANALRDLGSLDEAIAHYRKALARQPDHHACALNYAAALFFREDWGAGWEAFEARLAARPLVPPISAVDPRTGENVAPMRWRTGPRPTSLLVFGEQGLGDTIQFVRFLPDLVRSGCRVTLITDRRLFRLLSTLDRGVALVPRHEHISVPEIQAWIPLLSLPMALGLRPGGLAPHHPYLSADPQRVAHWRSRLGAEGIKVGIAWQGNPSGDIDRGRSIPLSLYAPLARIPGVRLISLQKGPGEEQLGQVPFADRIELLGAEFDAGPDGFVDTAAVMMSLDLVITTDSAIAHLAGALGRPFWILLKMGADWRWLLKREDSPFYPTARLFRQSVSGEWTNVLSRVAHELERLAETAVDAGKASAASSTTSQMLSIPGSPGELADKITILEIKSERIRDAGKLTNVRHELALLLGLQSHCRLDGPEIRLKLQELKKVNGQLWDIEDQIRECERNEDFGPRFVELARAIYRTNDRRSSIKREINQHLGSTIMEEKSYVAY